MILRDITRNFVLTALAAFFMMTFGATAFGQIAAWDFTGEASPATSAADVFNANLDSSSDITRGPNAVTNGASNSFRTTGFQNNGISTANTDYFQVTLSASPGAVLSLSTINARYAGTATYAASPGVSSQFAYSTDGTNFTLIGSPSVTVGTPATSPQIDLTGIAALQNVPAATTITIRYYASGQTTTGGWGFNSPAAGQFGLAIGGNVLTPTAANGAISGRVTSSRTNRGLEGVTVTLSGGSMVAPIVIQTDQRGRYRFTSVPTNAIYTVTVSSKRYRFNQSSSALSLTGYSENVDFAGEGW